MSDHKTIENNLKDNLSGDLLMNALDFVTYMKSIGMTADDGARFCYKNEAMCILIPFKDKDIPSGGLCICDSPMSEHSGYPIDESVKEYARANVKKCDGCGRGKENVDCGHEERGATKTIFGKEYDKLCSSEIMFFNPDSEDMKKIKKLMDLWKYKLDNVVGYSSQDR